jgi:ATP-binding cassette subfamily F protein 3
VFLVFHGRLCSMIDTPSASQQVSRKDNRVEAAGLNKSYDIHIENFDVSYGNR